MPFDSKLTRKQIAVFTFGVLLSLITLTYLLNTPNKLLKQGDQFLQKNDLKAAFKAYQKAAILYPLNPNPHIKLSEVFSRANDWKKARNEILLAIDLSKDKEVLSRKLREIEDTLNQPAKLREEMAYWEKIAGESPDYRDAWIQISIRHYQLYDTPNALNALKRAKQIDPNNETIKKLEEIYSKE